MVYRCDLQHFIVHAIDYFTLPDLTNMQYAIISAKISSGGRARNVVKVNDLYPDVDTIMAYEDYKDMKTVELANMVRQQIIDTINEYQGA